MADFGPNDGAKGSQKRSRSESGESSKHPAATSLPLRRAMTTGQQSMQLSVWFNKASDLCYYIGAQRACRECNKRLAKLKLGHVERKLLLAVPGDPEAVVEKLRGIMEDQEKQAKRPTPRTGKRYGEFSIKFYEVVAKISCLVHILPQTAEFKAPFGLLMVLFNAVVARRDREDSILVHLEAISAALPPIDFFQIEQPTSAMKVVATNIYVEVVRFLEEALVYYRSGRLSKIVDAVLGPTEAKFSACVAAIEKEMKKMEDPANLPDDGPTVDTQNATQSGKMLLKLFESVEESTKALTASVEMLNDRITGVENTLKEMGNFERARYAQALQAALLSTHMDIYWDVESSLARLVKNTFRMQLKDHWENNGVLQSLSEWAQGSGTDRPSLLWIGGQSGDQETWVTNLSTDMVQALIPQRVTLLYVFCSDMSANGVTPTPTRLVKCLITQILALKPELAYANPSRYNTQGFQMANTFALAWQIFEDLMSGVDDAFLVIDRIEDCAADAESDLTNSLLPSLLGLLQRVPMARAIITSIYEPPEDLLDMDEDGVMENIYIDTVTRPLQAPR